MANAFEQASRLEKSMRLIAAVGGFAARYGLDVEQVARLASESDRQVFAKLAGVHPPSDETWAIVVDAIAGAKSIMAQVAP